METPVLVVGGGLVGLSAALFLSFHSIPCGLVERRSQPSILPRSRGVHTRTMELFRQIGIEDRVHEAGKAVIELGGFGGARLGRTLVESEPLPIDRQHLRVDGVPSPSRFCFCPQVVLEPLLRDIAVERGVDVRSGVTLTGLDGARGPAHPGGAPAPPGVRATVDGPGGAQVIDARYVIAADGAASTVRSLLGVTSSGLPPTHRYVNLFFRADLTELVRGRTFSQCEVANEHVRGVFASKNNTDEWTFHLEADGPPVRPFDESIRLAIGADVDVEVLSSGEWDTGVAVADAYRVGNVFLAGDAAHRHAPWGGFGANTGIADVHNLAWKLAQVLAGADDTLLDTYEPERRPLAVRAGEQARLRTDFHARYSLETPQNRDDLRRQVPSDAVMTLYQYGGTSVDHLTGQIGTRFPHWYVEPEVSTLDLIGPGYTLFVGPAAPHEWASPASVVHRLNLHELGLPADGAVLVRPDGHVADRSDHELTPLR
jgi:putative polyketide hydroxylase